jgi:hypothetical protein
MVPRAMASAVSDWRPSTGGAICGSIRRAAESVIWDMAPE